MILPIRIRCTLAAFLVLAVASAARSQPADAFSRLDKNGDGKLTRDEFPKRMRQALDRVDADHDGAVTREEFRAFRRLFRAQANRRPAPGLPEQVKLIEDIPYAGTDNPRQKLDLLLPTKPNSDKPLPVVAFIHGGAWRAGDKRSGRRNVAGLVAGGNYAGVSIGYRLTGEAIWPAQIYDCKAAIRWIRANARKYNLDPDRIGVWGSSAGGHLVAMLGTSGDVKELEGSLGGDTSQSSRVACVVDFFGPTELLAMGKYPSRMRHNAPDSPESVLVGGPLQEMQQTARAASPTTYVSKDDPPFLIVHGTDDPLVPINQSERLDAALKKVGVESIFIHVKGAGHGGFRNPEVGRRVELFFDRHLRGKNVEVSSETIEQ